MWQQGSKKTRARVYVCVCVCVFVCVCDRWVIDTGLCCSWMVFVGEYELLKELFARRGGDVSGRPFEEGSFSRLRIMNPEKEFGEPAPALPTLPQLKHGMFRSVCVCVCVCVCVRVCVRAYCVCTCETSNCVRVQRDATTTRCHGDGACYAPVPRGMSLVCDVKHFPAFFADQRGNGGSAGLPAGRLRGVRVQLRAEALHTSGEVPGRDRGACVRACVCSFVCVRLCSFVGSRCVLGRCVGVELCARVVRTGHVCVCVRVCVCVSAL